jgi:hypothetical protein
VGNLDGEELGSAVGDFEGDRLGSPVGAGDGVPPQGSSNESK